MVGEVVHLISHRLGHLIVVHIIGMPVFMGWILYGLFNGFMFLPIFSFNIPQFQLGFLIGIFGFIIMKFIVIDGLDHYIHYDKFVGKKEESVSESGTQFNDIERIKPGTIQFKVFRDIHRDKQAMALREDEVAIEI